MERVEFLMLRLLEQYRRNESPAELIAALGRIEQELLLSFTTEKKLQQPVNDFENLHNEEVIVSNSEEILEEEPLPLLEIFQDVIQPEILEKEDIITNINKNAEEIPMQDVKILHLEINEIHSKKAVEISQHLQEASIKDLRKAIGINDKYLFINELFGGDEKLFENSIKTINQFNIFAEADFWIKKELIAIKKWNLDLPVVEQFMLLVKRRFS
jgi:hypothetical protein